MTKTRPRPATRAPRPRQDRLDKFTQDESDIRHLGTFGDIIAAMSDEALARDSDPPDEEPSTEIAALLGCAQTTVSAALRRVEARTLAAMDVTAQTIKVKQLLQLDNLFREAYGQWERSKADRTTKTRRQVDVAGGVQHVAEAKVVDGLGDALSRRSPWRAE